MVAVQGKHEQVALLTPDDTRDPPRIVRSTETATEIEIPRLKIYSVLVFNQDR